jgi:DNA-binding LacI/PurR family transcriptional regulator
VPEDVSVVGFDDSAYSSLITPALTTAQQPIYEMATHAGRIIVERLLLQQPMKNKKLLYDCVPIIRDSTAKPRK